MSQVHESHNNNYIKRLVNFFLRTHDEKKFVLDQSVLFFYFRANAKTA